MEKIDKEQELLNQQKQDLEKREKELYEIKKLQKEKTNEIYQQQQDSYNIIKEETEKFYSDYTNDLRDLNIDIKHNKKQIQKLSENNINSILDFFDINLYLKEINNILELNRLNLLQHFDHIQIKNLKKDKEKIDLLYKKLELGEISKTFLEKMNKKDISEISIEEIRKEQFNINLMLDFENLKKEVRTKQELKQLSINVEDILNQDKEKLKLTEQFYNNQDKRLEEFLKDNDIEKQLYEELLYSYNNNRVIYIEDKPVFNKIKNYIKDKVNNNINLTTEETKTYQKMIRDSQPTLDRHR